MKPLKSSVFILVAMLIIAGCIASSPYMTGAKIAMNERDWHRALTNLDTVLTNDPNNAEAWWRRGDCYEKLRDWGKMSQCYDRSLEISELYKSQIEGTRDKLIARYIARANAAYDSSMWEDGLAYVDTALVIDPRSQNFILFLNGAIIALNGDHPDRAYDYALRAVEVEPADEPDETVREILLMIASQRGDSEEAVRWAQELLSVLDPEENANNYLSALNTVIGAYETAEEYDQAIEALRSAVTLFPDTTYLRVNIAVLLDRIGDEEGAIGVYEEVLDIEPNNIDANRNLGYILLENERYDEAIPHMERVRALKPDDPVIVQNLMVAYNEMGDVESFSGLIESLERFHAEAPNNINIIKALMNAYSVTGQDPKVTEMAYKLQVLLGSGNPSRGE